MSVEQQIIEYADDLRPVRWIARKLSVTRQRILEVLAADTQRMKREEQSRNRVEKMISDARRSNLPVHQICPVLREWGPKDPPNQAGRGNHFLPSGRADRDFRCVAVGAVGG